MALAQNPPVLDDFSDPLTWTAAPAEGVSLKISEGEGFRGTGMRMDVDFRDRGGYVIARKELDLELPENYEFTFRIRGDLPNNNLEFKLIDPSGENVWWVNRRMFDFPEQWQLIRVKKRHVSFAWGPQGGGEMERVAAIEFAISVGSGGKGTVWIDELTFRPREPERPYTDTPRATASSAAASTPHVLDDDPSTFWRTPARRGWLALDFLREREYGGAVVEWGTPWARAYDVEISEDGRSWETLLEVRDSNGGLDYLYLPDTESRHFRLRLRDSAGGAGYEIRSIAIQPPPFAESKTAFFSHIASLAPRGLYPRYLLGEQSYWTVAGAPADEEEILLNEDGMIEVGGVGGFSIEPFVWLEHSRELVTWADVETTSSLAGGTLPIPSVAWSHPLFVLEITAMAGGEPGRSAARAQYRLEPRSPLPLEATLYVAIRPFQVNPPWQFLNIVGGFAEIRSIEWDALTATVNGQVPLTPEPAATDFGATRFETGTIVEELQRGTLPAAARATDSFGAASGAFAWTFTLEPARSRTFALNVPLHAGAPHAPPLPEIRQEWQSILEGAEIDLPPAADEIERTLRSNVAWILVNQDEAAIQPGSRAYDRSWIRDGSLTSAALLRFGHFDAVRRFIQWYAPFQRPDGYVPCCVGKRGADPVPEHDSHGQLIFVIAEYVRQTGDLELARSMWPHVKAAVDFIERARQERMTPAYQADEKRAYYGLLPESISHEGYSAKPVHSYWDQLFALKGLKDAAWLAAELVRETCAEARGARSPMEASSRACGMLEIQRALMATLRDAFRNDLAASFERTMAMHGIDTIPGSVELGDFDATSTTIALEPVDARQIFPEGALERTFEKYWENFVARREGRIEWDAYTPYEHRVVGAFIRLGWIDRAHEALAWFMDDRRPKAWNHWAEVVWQDPRAPKFIGDMPHTWVGSDFVRSVIDFLAYEREADRSLVLGAGVVEEWAREGFSVRNLRTHYGPLTWAARAEDEGVRVTIDEGTRIPPGGIVLAFPFLDEPVVVRSLPASLLLPTSASVGPHAVRRESRGWRDPAGPGSGRTQCGPTGEAGRSFVGPHSVRPDSRAATIAHQLLHSAERNAPDA